MSRLRHTRSEAYDAALDQATRLSTESVTQLMTRLQYTSSETLQDMQHVLAIHAASLLCTCNDMEHALPSAAEALVRAADTTITLIALLRVADADQEDQEEGQT